jgi:hypothetical protein
MEGDEQSREERARRLHEEIEKLKTGREPPQPPASPREFIERQMREGNEDENEDAGGNDEDVERADEDEED